MEASNSRFEVMLWANWRQRLSTDQSAASPHVLANHAPSGQFSTPMPFLSDRLQESRGTGRQENNHDMQIQKERRFGHDVNSYKKHKRRTPISTTTKQATRAAYSIESLSEGFFYTVFEETSSMNRRKSWKINELEKTIELGNGILKRQKHTFK